MVACRCRCVLRNNEAIIDFTNGALTKFLINLSLSASQSDARVIGSYFHVLNAPERIGDHAESFREIGEEMRAKKIEFSEIGQADKKTMHETIMQMLDIAKDAFENLNKDRLHELTALENTVYAMKNVGYSIINPIGSQKEN